MWYWIGGIVAAFALGVHFALIFRERMVTVELSRAEQELALAWEEVRRLRAQVASLIGL